MWGDDSSTSDPAPRSWSGTSDEIPGATNSTPTAGDVSSSKSVRRSDDPRRVHVAGEDDRVRRRGQDVEEPTAGAGVAVPLVEVPDAVAGQEPPLVHHDLLHHGGPDRLVGGVTSANHASWSAPSIVTVAVASHRGPEVVAARLVVAVLAGVEEHEPGQAAPVDRAVDAQVGPVGRVEPGGRELPPRPVRGGPLLEERRAPPGGSPGATPW